LLARFSSFFAFFFASFRPALTSLRLALVVLWLTCCALSVAAVTSGVSVARALSQLLDAASLALTAVGCTRSRAA
jgi:hypothetical protein